MAATSIQVPYPVFYDRDGQPLDNGNIYIGVANLDPVGNPIQVYYDEALTIPASQPLKTSNGYIYRNGTPAQLYVNAVNFSILVNDENNLLVYSFPDGTGVQSYTDAQQVEYDPPFTGALTTGYTVADKLQQTVSVQDFGAVGDGVADDTAAFLAAFATSSKHIYVPSGSYRLTATIDMNGFGRVLEGDGRDASVIYIDHAGGGFRSLGQHQSILGVRFICARGAGSAFAISSSAAYFTAKDVFTDWGGVGKFVNGVIIPAGSAQPYVRYFENCLFSTTSGDAFFVEDFSFNHAAFVGCTFRSAGGHGFHLYGGSSHGVSFHGCRAENNLGNGFNITGRRGNQASWHGVYLENNSGAGIYLGSTAPAWNTDADYMESSSISGLTAWENGLAAVVAEKCMGVTVAGATVGANNLGKFTLGAFRAGWPGYPLKGPQMKLDYVNRRGSATDYDIVAPTSQVMVEAGEGRDATYDQGWAPSSNITRINASGGRYGYVPTGAYASNNITLGRRAALTSPGVSAFATTNSVMGPSASGAIIACDTIDLDAVPENSQINAIIASDYSCWNTSTDKYRQVILASSRVKSVNNATITGGVAYSGAALSSNRKWEIDSTAGNITIAGTVTTGAIFADFAEMFPNATGVEIPLGVIVAQENGAVRPANGGDDIIGVVTATAAITAGDTPFAWQGRYLSDEWGQTVTDKVADPNWKGKAPAPLISIPRQNPDWDPSLPQIPRSERPADWTRVGMLGQVFVRVSADVVPNDSLSAINGVGVKSLTKTGLRCLKITTPYSDQKGYAVAKCLINVAV